MIIAVGVNSRPSTPSGPLRESIRKTIRPTTTGGRPMKVLSSRDTTPRAGKLVQRDGRTQRKPDQARNRHSAQTDPQGQPDDLKKICVQTGKQRASFGKGVKEGVHECL